MKLRDLPTPCYVIDEERLTENLRILEGGAPGDRL